MLRRFVTAVALSVLASAASAAPGNELKYDIAIGYDAPFIELVAIPPVKKPVKAPTEANLLDTYADIALAGYQDALIAAKNLDAAIASLIANPNHATLGWAQVCWRLARIPYLQTEVFRFGNPIVDEWERRVNGWPLDDRLMDYVDESNGRPPAPATNIVANTKIVINGVDVNATEIDVAFLRDTLAGTRGDTVTTGYHAIEFLLWGQDLAGTGPGVGMRPFTDYSTAEHADRRAAYLKSASSLLVADLEAMVRNWEVGGAARTALPQIGLSAILKGMVSLGIDEMAGKRMTPSLTLHDPEQEQDRFSDYTHISLLMNGVGIRNVYQGHYIRTDGSVIEGPSLSDLIATKSPALDEELGLLIRNAVAKLTKISDRAEFGQFYDEQIGESSIGGNGVVQAAIDALVEQTHGMERAAVLLGIDAGMTIESNLPLPVEPEIVSQ